MRSYMGFLPGVLELGSWLLEVPSSRPGFPEAISDLLYKALATPEWSWLLEVPNSQPGFPEAITVVFLQQIWGIRCGCFCARGGLGDLI